jgi:carbamoyltransferase
MSLIVGLNAFHPDSSACVLKDGKLVATVAEERLGERRKHVAGFPARALCEVLRMGEGLSLECFSVTFDA